MSIRVLPGMEVWSGKFTGLMVTSKISLTMVLVMRGAWRSSPTVEEIIYYIVYKLGTFIWSNGVQYHDFSIFSLSVSSCFCNT